MTGIPPPALLYHKVSPRWEVGVTRVKPSTFRRQMEGLAKAGWRTTLPDEFRFTGNIRGVGGTADRGGPAADARKEFLLIFDDGYECVYRYALPVLRDLGFRAVVFIPSGYIGGSNDWDHHLLGRRFRHLTLEMLDDLVLSGWRIGSHTATHPSLPHLNDDQLLLEIDGSRRKLQEITGQEVEWISFPFGRYDRRVIEASRRAGYHGAVVPVRRASVDVPDDFRLIEAGAVYLWDTAGMVSDNLNGGDRYPVGRWLRRAANRLSAGTIMWKRIFHECNNSEPLATDG